MVFLFLNVMCRGSVMKTNVAEKVKEVPSTVFDIPTVEMPTAFQDVAAKTISQTQDNLKQMKNTANRITDILQETFAAGTKGVSVFNLKLIETVRDNVAAGFEFIDALATVRSPVEIGTLLNDHVRSQFKTLSAQNQELATLAQKVVVDTTEPMKVSLAKVQSWTGAQST